MLVLSKMIKQQVEPLIGSFDLFGVDLILDANQTLYCLEVNSNPAIYTDTEVLKNIIPLVVRNTIDTVEKAHIPFWTRPFEDKPGSIFEVLHDDSRNYTWLPDGHCS